MILPLPLARYCFSHPLALAKISCEIWGTKTSLSRLQQLRRVDGGESSQNYFEILYKLNAESALGLAISDLQSILKERETTPNLGLEAIPLVKWLVLRRGALVGVASSIEQSALPCLRMLTLEDIGLNSGIIGYFKDLYNARREIAAREIGAHLVAIVDEQGKDPALDISKKPIIQWFIATPSVFKDVFATDKLFRVETKTRISLGLKVLECMQPKYAKEVMLDQLDKGTGENDFSSIRNCFMGRKRKDNVEGYSSHTVCFN